MRRQAACLLRVSIYELMLPGSLTSPRVLYGFVQRVCIVALRCNMPQKDLARRTSLATKQN